MRGREIVFHISDEYLSSYLFGGQNGDLSKCVVLNFKTLAQFYSTDLKVFFEHFLVSSFLNLLFR